MNEHTPAKFEKPVEDYLRVATIAPEVAIADPRANVTNLLESYEAAKAQQAELVVSPELSLVGYTTADLLHNHYVLEQTEISLTKLAEQTMDGPALLVGAPLEHNDVLYNCAVMLAEGKVHGVVPKVHLPNYKEFYEMRWFTSGQGVEGQTITVGEQEVPFGTDILFDVNDTKVAAEVCEDMFAPISPATQAALAGAEVVANLSASNELIGKPGYRKMLIGGFTGRLICGYVYASAGRGESVADVIYGGHQIIGELGRLSAERAPLGDDHTPLVYDIDRTYLEHDRIVNKTWAGQAAQTQQAHDYRMVAVTVPRPDGDELLRRVDPLPFVPSNPETLDQRCEEIYNSLGRALAQRIEDAGSDAVVLGLSGGLDSTLALLVALEATKITRKDDNFIHTITMPGMASSERTQDNASLLAKELGTTHSVIPVSEMATTLLKAIGHDQQTEDITYENAQARMRTTILMNYANMVHGFVEGTGDMSENAIGWCTYNGDHMSMFNPNAAVPKTLVKHLVSWYAEHRTDGQAQAILRDIVATPVSPELTGNGDLSQTTEDIVGPYELTDFFMNEQLRYGSRPAKIGYLATRAFEGVYDNDTIDKWLGMFFKRHTASQWKRDVAPNSTKVGSVSQSPRGDLRMAPNTSRSWYQ